MRIAYVTPEFVTESIYGGQARYISNIATIFADHGHDVVVVTKSDIEQTFLWKDHVTVVRTKCRFRYEIISRVLGLFEISFFLNKRIIELHREMKFDVVQFSNLRGIPLLMNKRLPCIVRLSNFQPAWDAALLEEYDPNCISISRKHKKCIRALRKARIVFGPSEVCAKMTSDVAGVNVEVVESPAFMELREKEPSFFREQIKGRSYVVFYGSLNYLKGLRAICDCAEMFLDLFTNECLVFMGLNCLLYHEGAMISSFEYIEKRIQHNKDRVICLGRVRDKEHINHIIRNSDICIMPSRIDNLPNTCIEAMGLGAVVIGTNGASFEQIINDSINGFLCEIDDPSSLYEKMEKAMRMSEIERASMKERAQDTIGNINPEEIYKKTLDLYQRVAEL